MPPRKSTSSVTPADPDPNPNPSSPTPHQGSSPHSQSQSQATRQGATGTVTATEQQLKARAEAGVNVEDHLLPRSLTQRLAKSVLPPNTTIQKDALLAIQKAATVFVSYLASHANDATLKRTIAPSDVLSAITELEFDAFRPRLEKELDAHAELKAGKRKKGGDQAAGKNGQNDVQKTGGGNEEEEGDAARGAKRVKRQEEGPEGKQKDGDGDGDETQEEEPEPDDDVEDDVDDIEEEEDEQDDEEDGDEGEDDNEETQAEDDINRVEDLDRDSTAKRTMDPDVAGDDSDMEDETGPSSQLQENMGLG